MRVNQTTRSTDLASSLSNENGTFIAQQYNSRTNEPVGSPLVLVCEKDHSIISCRTIDDSSWDVRKVSESTEAGQDALNQSSERERRSYNRGSERAASQS